MSIYFEEKTHSIQDYIFTTLYEPYSGLYNKLKSVAFKTAATLHNKQTWTA